MKESIARIAKWAMYFSLAGWGITFLFMGRLPDNAEILPPLLEQPAIFDEQKGEFTVDYRGIRNIVRPVKYYDIHGLVVSHNDPGKWYRFDITHDEKSLNTRDLCIIWGDNLQDNNFQNVSFHNDDTFCLYDYGPETHFSNVQMSNNHLITDRDYIRDMIANVHVGDQVHIKGWLADYAEDRWDGRWRKTSMGFNDSGNNACEIIFVEEMNILRSKTGFWAKINHAFFIATLMLFIARTLLFISDPVPVRRKKKPDPADEATMAQL